MTTVSLTVNQLEQLTKQRRDTQDLDLEQFIKVKKQVLQLLTDIKKDGAVNDEKLTKINQLENDLKAAKLKVDLGLHLESIRHTNSINDLNTHSQRNSKMLTDMIITSTKEYKNLQQRVSTAKEILHNREKLNKTISDYFEKSKVITLSLTELRQLFDNDGDDLKLVLTSGKLVKEDKTDPNKTIYEFVFAKNSSFQLSLEELQSKIQSQINECEEVQRKIDLSKQKWRDASQKLVNMLSSIETEVL